MGLKGGVGCEAHGEGVWHIPRAVGWITLGAYGCIALLRIAQQYLVVARRQYCGTRHGVGKELSSHLGEAGPCRLRAYLSVT